MNVICRYNRSRFMPPPPSQKKYATPWLYTNDRPKIFFWSKAIPETIQQQQRKHMELKLISERSTNVIYKKID